MKILKGILRKNNILNFTAQNVILIAILFIALSLSGCGNSKQSTPISKSAFLLDTIVEVTLYDSTDESILEEAIALCEYYHNKLNKNLETSLIGRINNRKEEENTFDLDDDVLELFEKSLYYGKLSEGKFDITIGPVSELWDFQKPDFILPEPAEISKKIKYVDYNNLAIENNKLILQSPFIKLDMGGIAKGYIADRIKDFLLEKGVKSAVINLGGNVLCVGSKPDGSPFKIGLQKPFDNRKETAGVLNISDKTVVSSGVYERNRLLNGVNYHHLLNTETGYPIENGLVSVTIITDVSVDGEGLSTTCFALGLEEGMKLIDSIPDAFAVFIDSEGILYYSEGAEVFVI